MTLACLAIQFYTELGPAQPQLVILYNYNNIDYISELYDLHFILLLVGLAGVGGVGGVGDGVQHGVLHGEGGFILH